MNNILKISVFFALFLCFLSIAQEAKASQIPPVKIDQVDDIIFNFNVGQSGPGQLTATWNSTCPGPYNVVVLDITNGGFLFVAGGQVNNTSYTLGGLQVKHTYWVVVTDCDTTFGKAILITF